MSSKALLVAMRAILSPKFWRKVVPCEKIADLYAHCTKEEVVLPDFVPQYEKEMVSIVFLSSHQSACACMRAFMYTAHWPARARSCPLG